MKTKIFITGSSGFIGGRIVEYMNFCDDYQVYAGIRQWASAARIARFPVQMVICDIMDLKQVQQALAEVDVVIHCAVQDEHSVIVGGTRNLLEVSQELGIKHFLYLSTAEVYGDAEGDIEETHPFGAGGNIYADSKCEAEELCLSFQKKGLPVTIFRPSIVGGPFGEMWTQIIAKRILSKRWGLFEDYGDGLCNYVYIDDLILAICSSIFCEEAYGEAFNINGPDRISWNEYFKKYGEALGISSISQKSSTSTVLRSIAKIPVTFVADYALNKFGEQIMDIYMRNAFARKIMKSVKTSLDTTPGDDELRLYKRKAYYNSSKAQRVLGYQPKYDIASSLHMSALWLEHHGYFNPGPRIL